MTGDVTVLLHCRACRRLGLATIDPKRHYVVRAAALFRPVEAGEMGIQFRCSKCGQAVEETPRR